MYSEGSERLLASNLSEPRYCPIELTKKYLKFLGSNYQAFLLPQCHPANPKKPNPEKFVNYTTALDDFRDLMNTLGYPGKDFGLHSGRRGGATHAAEAGADVHDLQRMAGWHSETVPSKYVDLSTQKRLRLSKLLSKKCQ